MTRSAEERKEDWRRASYNAISAVLARDYSYRNAWWHTTPNPNGPDVAQDLQDWRRFVAKVKKVYEADKRVAPNATDITANFDSLRTGNLGKLANAIVKRTRRCSVSQHFA
jgi:hypothetical protein